jgi:hypothetical protein
MWKLLFYTGGKCSLKVCQSPVWKVLKNRLEEGEIRHSQHAGNELIIITDIGEMTDDAVRIPPPAPPPDPLAVASPNTKASTASTAPTDTLDNS